MPLTEFQRKVCRLLAERRLSSGAGYVAGGVALNQLINAPRVSRDIDLFHDSAEAVLSSWQSDREVLENNGYHIDVIREFPAFVEVEVAAGHDSVVLQWVHDSAYRFFPLIEHPDFGLVLHPFDLAVNKTLALIGRVEVRDWVDIIECHRSLQPFGYLVWAASGKDPGLNPLFIMEQAGRSAHYSKEEYELLAFEGKSPNPVELSATWRDMLSEGRRIIGILPEDHIGCCVVDGDGNLCKGQPDDLQKMLDNNEVRFHSGAIRGAWPAVVR